MPICCFELSRYGNVFENFHYWVHKGSHWSLSWSKKSNLNPHILVFKDPFEYNPPLWGENNIQIIFIIILPCSLASLSGLFFLVFHKKFCSYFSSHPCVLHALLISFKLVKLTYISMSKTLNFEVHKKVFFFFFQNLCIFSRELYVFYRYFHRWTWIQCSVKQNIAWMMCQEQTYQMILSAEGTLLEVIIRGASGMLLCVSKCWNWRGLDIRTSHYLVLRLCHRYSSLMVHWRLYWQVICSFKNYVEHITWKIQGSICYLQNKL